jgi:hypothetical protein
MFEAVVEDFEGKRRYTVTVEVDEPESALLDRIDGVREHFDVTVGSYPGEYVSLKLGSTDEETVEAAAEWLRDRVELADQSR